MAPNTFLDEKFDICYILGARNQKHIEISLSPTIVSISIGHAYADDHENAADLVIHYGRERKPSSSQKRLLQIRYDQIKLSPSRLGMTSQNQHTNLSVLSAILLCATIVSTILFAGSEGGNTFNFYVTAVFVAVVTATALLERRPFLFVPEITLLMLWLCYALLPSIGAQALDLAYIRMRQMLQIIVLSLLSINVMIWYGRTAIFALLFFGSAVLAYVASLAGFGFGVIDESVLQELNSGDRIVGTTGNANRFAMICLQSQLAAVFFGVQVKNAYAKLASGLAIAILGLAIIHTGSRTALVGMLFFIFGLVWVFRVWRIRYMARTILMIVVLGLIGTGTYLTLDDNHEIRTRMDSYLANKNLMGRYENLLRLFVNFGDIDSLDNSVEGSMSERTQLMNNAWKAASEAPLGLGLDNFKVHSGAYAHSNYFELLATTGFPGLALYMMIYIFLLRRILAFVGIRDGTKAMVRVFAISIITLIIMDIGTVSYFDKPNWIFIALAIASIELVHRTISSQSVTNRQSRTFAYSTH